jgi:molybdate transport repressor ModE-like protein
MPLFRGIFFKNFSMLDFSHFLTLDAISRHGSFSKAAEELGMTQSAVSQNIKRIETMVNFSVVSKQGKTVSLTKQGERLAAFGRDYLKKIDQLFNHIHEENKTIAGEISIGTLNGIGKSWLAPKLLEFTKAYPQLQIKLLMEFPGDLLNLFEKNKLDFIILPESFIPAHAERVHLEDEYSTLVFPDSDKFPITKDSTIKEILDYPLICFQDRDPLFYDWCREKFNFAPRNIKPRLVINSFSHILEAVSQNLGIAVIPTHVLSRYFYKDNVKTLGKAFEMKKHGLYLIHPEGAFEQEKNNLLLKHLKA